MILFLNQPSPISILYICIIIALFISFTNSYDFRSYNGENNNEIDPKQGSANQPFIRISKPTNFNVKGIPYSGNSSPRVISNIVYDQTQRIPSKENYTDLFNVWGKFLINNLVSIKINNSNSWPINVPKCDTSFDSTCKGNKTIDYKRSAYVEIPCSSNFTIIDEGSNKCYEQINSISSYIDGKAIYGNNEDISILLRSLQGGEMKMTQTAELGDLPPKNIPGVPVDNDANLFPTSQLFSLGERRGNENPGLLAIHTIFLREHNRLARHFSRIHSNWDDEAIYQHSRSCIIEQIQKITYEEFIPLLLGDFPLYNGYRSNVNAQISNEFSTIAFKFIDSELGPNIEYFDENNTRLQPLPLKFSYFNPHTMNQGIEPIIRGLYLNEEENVDTYMTSDLRNFLYGKPGQGGGDLASIDIQRSRDHGIALYNDLRKQLGLKKALNWSDITKDIQVQNRLKQAFKTVDDIDSITGGLAEDHMNSGCVGQLFYSIIYNQFYRIRTGDRFWYEDLNMKLINHECQPTTLSNLIKRTTLNINNIPSNIFKKQLNKSNINKSNINKLNQINRNK